MILRLLVFGLTLITAMLLETVVAPALVIAGTRPDLILLTVVGLGLAEGPATGMRYGFVAGLAIDLLAGGDGIVGLSTLVLLLIGYFSGAARPYLVGNDLLGQVFVGATAAALAVVTRGLLDALLGLRAAEVSVVLVDALAAGAYAGVLAPIVCMLVQRLASAVPVTAQGT